jgi:hypothetical protein
MEIKKLVREFIDANPAADIVDATKYARILFTDEVLTDAFFSHLFKAKVKKADQKTTMERIWPAARGY